VDSQTVLVFETKSIEQQRKQSGSTYLEFLRKSSMSVGFYVVAAGTVDQQSPHKEDELYYVVRGKGRMRAGSEDHHVGPGSLLFIAAEVDHRFYDIEEELTVLVFFAPAETV
jgi:mannose-6-phosphate isomerase-like protein (cupin superfamily)